MSSSRCQKLIGFIGIFHVVLLDVDALTDETEVETAAEGEARQLLPMLVVAVRTDAAALLFQQGTQHAEILIFVDFIENPLLDVRIDALLPKSLLYFPATPLVVADLVFDEGTGIAFIIDIAFLDETVDDAVLYDFIEFPASHFVAHLLLAVLCLGTKRSQLQVGFLFGYVFFHILVALRNRALPNWSWRIEMS